MKDSELENPPNVELESEKNISHNRKNKGHGGHEERHRSEITVNLRYFTDVLLECHRLPEREKQKYRRKDQVDQAIGNEYDPESYDQKSQKHDWHIHLKARIDLLTVKPDEHGKQDGDKKKGELNYE